MKLRSLEEQGGAETLAKGFDVEKEKIELLWIGRQPGGSTIAQHGDAVDLAVRRRKSQQ